MSHQTLESIIAKELELEYNDILSYRKAVASGIEDIYDSVLDDSKVTDALKLVADYYKSKNYKQKDETFYDSDDAYAGNIQDGFDFGRD